MGAIVCGHRAASCNCTDATFPECQYNILNNNLRGICGQWGCPEGNLYTFLRLVVWIFVKVVVDAVSETSLEDLKRGL